MIENDTLTLVIGFIILFGYGFLVLFVNKWAHPYRMRMAVNGKILLADPNLTESQKIIVDRKLDHAYDSTILIKLFFIYTPVYFIRKIKQKSTQKKKVLAPTNEESLKRWQQFGVDHLIAISASNPPAAVLLFMILAPLIIVNIIIGICIHSVFNFTIWIQKILWVPSDIIFSYRDLSVIFWHHRGSQNGR
jgi:hypothetical protein